MHNSSFDNIIGMPFENVPIECRCPWVGVGFAVYRNLFKRKNSREIDCYRMTCDTRKIELSFLYNSKRSWSVWE